MVKEVHGHKYWSRGLPQMDLIAGLYRRSFTVFGVFLAHTCINNTVHY